MRRSLYLKDDDYRLSFLYGNFTTLTRFTELDLERVVEQGLSPLYVSIHATDPEVRSRMLRNRRGAISLRWLRCLLDHGIEVHGQVVVCPGVNDGAVLHQTLAGVLDRFPELATVAVVPLGVSRYSNEPAMRPHTDAEARHDARRGERVAAALQTRRRASGRLGLGRVLPARGIGRSPNQRSTTASPSTRTGSGWCARSSRPSRSASRRRRAPAARRLGRASSPGSKAHRPRVTGLRGRAGAASPPARGEVPDASR